MTKDVIRGILAIKPCHLKFGDKKRCEKYNFNNRAPIPLRKLKLYPKRLKIDDNNSIFY